jgi:hypothetical protein
MTTTNSLYPNYPNIVISRLEEPYNPQEEIPNSLAEIHGLTGHVEGKVYIIADCTTLSPNFSQVVIGMAEAGRTSSTLRDERVVPMIVATGEIFESVVSWARQRQYGALEIGLHNSIESAVEYAKGLIDK